MKTNANKSRKFNKTCDFKFADIFFNNPIMTPPPPVCPFHHKLLTLFDFGVKIQQFKGGG